MLNKVNADKSKMIGKMQISKQAEVLPGVNRNIRDKDRVHNPSSGSKVIHNTITVK